MQQGHRALTVNMRAISEFPTTDEEAILVKPKPKPPKQSQNP